MKILCLHREILQPGVRELTTGGKENEAPFDKKMLRMPLPRFMLRVRRHLSA